MEQVFRIEIPVEVTSKSDLGKVQQIQAILEKADQEARKLASSADSAFNKISSGASSAASAMDQVNSAAQKSSDAMDKVSEATDEVGENAEDAADSMDEIGDAAKDAGNAAKGAFDGAGQSADKFSQRMEKSERTLRSMFKEKLKMTMEAVDKISPVVKDIKEKVSSLAAKAWKVTVKLADLVTAPFRALKNMIMSPITMTLSIAGIGLGASSFYQTFTEFEAGMSNVKALSGATDEEFKKLTATASELGATTKFTAAEASEGMQYLAMAGWKTSDIIAGMPGLLQLAAAGGTDLGTAADIVSDVMTAMGMSAEEATRAADIFARTATSSNTTISMMGETLKYAAPIAHSFGLELSEVATITGMMANAGIKGGSAGTAIRSALLRMASPSKEAAKAMSALGLTFSDSTGKMKDMQTIMKDLGTAFRGLSEQEKLAFADDIFGKNAASAWLSVIEQGESAYNGLFEAIDNSEGAAQKMSEIQLDNLAGDVTLLQSAVDGMKVSLMDKVNPYLRSGVQWLTAQIPALTEAIGNFIDKGIAKAKELKELIGGVFNSEEFQNADSLADKFFIAWDKIIAEPFNAWWEGSGREFVLGIVKKVGSTFGEVLHGVVAGIFAAIKGEEIDFEGLNLTGIAKAGAEAAKEYVTSFVGGLNAGNLVSEMPGALKAGLIGFGAMKVGGGLYSGYKSFTSLAAAMKILKGGALTAAPVVASVGESVAAAGASAATGASAFGGLGSALAAIPGWGWAALAALTAVGIGYKVYHDQQEKQREKLLHMGDEVEAAGQRYVEAVQRVQDLDTTLEGIQEIKLRMTEDKQQNEEVIAQVKDEINSELQQYLTLQAKLADEFITEEERQQIQAQIAELDGSVTLSAKLEASGYNPLQAGIILAQFNSVKEAEKNVALNLATHTNKTPEEIATLTQNLTDLMAVREEKQLKITGYEKSAAEIEDLKIKASSLRARMSQIELKVKEGDGSQELIDEYNGYKAELAVIDLQLQGHEMSDSEKETLLGQVKEIESAIDECVVTLTMDPNSTFKQEDVNQLMELLATAGDHQWHLGVNLATGSVTAEDMEAFNQQLEAYAQHLEEISGGAIRAEEVLTGEISESTQGKIDRLHHTEELNREAAYWELRGSVAESRLSRGEVVGEREAAQEAVDSAASRVGTMAEAISNLQDLQAAGLLFENENRAAEAEYIAKHGELDEGYYENYNERLAAFGEKYGGQIATVEGLFDELGYSGLFTTWGDIEQMDGGPTADLFGTFIDSLAAVYSEALKNQSDAEASRDEWNDNLVQQYEAERNLATWDVTKGTAYEDMNIEQMAEAFNSMDTSGLQVFADAINALKGVNASTDYISGAEMTTPEQLAQTAYRSVTNEGNTTLIDSMRSGMQSIESGYAQRQQIDQASGSNTAATYAKEQATLINEALASIGSDVKVDEQLSNITDAFKALDEIKIEDMDFETALEPITKIAGDVGGIGEKVAEAKAKIVEMTGVDLSVLSFSSAADSASDLSSKASTAASNVNRAKQALDNLNGTTADTYVNEHHTTITDGAHHATGGIFSTAHVGLVAEDGPEAIIPLGGKRRERGLNLWMEAGRMLGVGAYAEGGILGPYSSMLGSLPDDVWDDDGDGSGDYKPSIATGNNGGGGGNVVQVSVDVNPEYNVNGGDDPEAVLEILRSHQNELAELLGSAMANQLEDIISNM